MKINVVGGLYKALYRDLRNHKKELQGSEKIIGVQGEKCSANLLKLGYCSKLGHS